MARKVTKRNSKSFSHVKCVLCNRKAGHAPLNRFGEPDMCPETPLGEITACPKCGRMTCPDCQYERECCELDEGKE